MDHTPDEPASAASLPPAVPPTQPVRKSAQVRTALQDGLRLAAFRAPRDGTLAAPWWLVGAMALLSLSAPLVYAFILTGPDGNFAFWSLPGAFFHLPLLALGMGAVAYLTHTVTRIAELLLAALLVFFWVDVLVYLTWQPVSGWLGAGDMTLHTLYYLLAPAWPALAATAYAARISPARRGSGLLAALAVLIIWVWPWKAQHADRQLWHAAQPDRAQAAPLSSPADEARLYHHARLLDAQLAELAPERPGQIDLYFIGVGGDASQEVFQREVNAVATLMASRFDAERRSVRLINSRSTLDSVPIASVTSVRESLKRIGERMNKDEDLLFLFLTSHGSETHQFTLQHWPVKFQELNPKVLRQLLDESGIRHRVLVVSACYSGGFIEALQNDDTLVLTAAAKDRTSFGCSNEAEWTYFGKAYFADALTQTRSFIEAFEAAKPAIEARERAEQHEPSRPQIHIGANIRSKLDAFQKQLDAQP